jgi:hypothetical protein
MKKSILYSFIAVLIGVLSMPAKISNGCGYYDASFYVYSFVKPSLIKSPSHRPFFFTLLTYFEDWKGSEFAAEENLKEWKNYFKIDGKNEADFKYLIYKSSIKELKALKYGDELTDEMQGNAVVQRLRKKKNTAFLNYLIFAKECEPFAVDREFDWDGTPINVAETKVKTDKIIERGLEKFNTYTDKFIKARYAFQLVRLARYSMDWEKTINLYEELIPQVKDVKTIINYWTREHYAGALYNIGQKTEAAYHFAQIFDKAPSRRMAAFNSFDIRSDKEWQIALDYCENNEEKAALYAVRAIAPFSNAVEEMKSIFDLSPKSSHLEFLLFREIQKFEYELLGATYSARHNDYKRYSEEMVESRKDTKQYLQELINLTREIVGSDATKNPHLWELAQGYLMFMDGDNAAAMEVFDELESKKRKYDKTFNAQLNVFRTAVIVDNIKTVDGEVEAKSGGLISLLESVRPSYWGDSGVSEEANYLLDKLGQLYRKQGDHAKAFLCGKGEFHHLLMKPDLKVVDGLIKLYDRRDNLNAFEKELLKPIFQIGEWTANGREYKKINPDIRNQLLEMKGTILLGKNQLEDAIATFEQLPEAYRNGRKTLEDSWEGPMNSKERFNISDNNPFYIHFNNSPNPSPLAANFNKLELAKQLLAIEKSLETTPKTRAASYLKLGNARFQMSYRGKSWRAIDYAWSVGGGNFMTNEDAIEYLNKAIEIGKEEDRESAAKACFVASACVVDLRKPLQKEYFGKLKDEFSDTEFYEQAIRECTWFQAYVNNN